MRHRNLLAVVAIAGLSGMSGCTDMESLATLSTLSDGLHAALPRVTSDLPQSCRRRNVLRADTPISEAAPAPLDCTPYEQAAAALSSDQTVLLDYLDALARLAAHRTPEYGIAIQQAGTEIGAVPGLSKHSLTAGNAAAKISISLTDVLTRRYRERKLHQLIVDTDASVQQLCAALQQVVGEDYASLLDDEALELQSFYGDPIAARRNEERLALVLVLRQRDQEVAMLEQRRSAADAYVRVLRQIASLHTQLLAEAEDRQGRRGKNRSLAPAIRALKAAVIALQTRVS